MDSVVLGPYFRGLNNYPSYPLLIPTTNSSSFFQSTCYKLRRHSISLSLRPNHTNPQNPVSEFDNCNQPTTPLSNLFPVLQRIKSLASKTKWVSVLRASIASDAAPEGYLKNGGIGMALLSVTSTAKVRLSPFMATLAANPTFVSGLFAWAIAQSIKVILNFFVEKKWDLRIMFASGGMPSSHSALCTAMTTSVAICHGVADSLFPVCLGFSLIVMYDAIGVRRHAGMQAEVLNMIVEDLFQGHPMSQRKLKEILGHTPSQFEDCTFDWLYWPQARQPYSADTIEYIKSLDAEEDIALLKFYGWDLPLECARTLRISTMLLKKGAERGLTPFAIGSIMCRENLTKKSVIEEIVEEAVDSLLPGTSEAAFLESVSHVMDRHLDEISK